MYCMIHSREVFFSNPACNEFKYIDVVAFEDEKLAKTYLKNRYYELARELKNDSDEKCRLLHCSVIGDKTYALISYVDIELRQKNSTYFYTHEEFNLIKIPMLSEANIKLKKIN